MKTAIYFLSVLLIEMFLMQLGFNANGLFLIAIVNYIFLSPYKNINYNFAVLIVLLSLIYNVTFIQFNFIFYGVVYFALIFKYIASRYLNFVSSSATMIFITSSLFLSTMLFVYISNRYEIFINIMPGFLLTNFFIATFFVLLHKKYYHGQSL